MVGLLLIKLGQVCSYLDRPTEAKKLINEAIHIIGISQGTDSIYYANVKKTVEPILSPDSTSSDTWKDPSDESAEESDWETILRQVG